MIVVDVCVFACFDDIFGADILELGSILYCLSNAGVT